MAPVKYTPTAIREAVLNDIPRLFAPYSEGRGPNWSTDTRTKEVLCLTQWLREEMTRLNLDDLGRITQEGEFNRVSRSCPDVFEAAAEVMNAVVEDRIDRYRKPHRRWG